MVLSIVTAANIRIVFDLATKKEIFFANLLL